MRELPEVETIRRDLASEVIGRRIDRVEVTGARTVRRLSSADELVVASVDRSVVGVDRRGKHLLVRLDDGGTVVVHLRMSGQVFLVDSDEARRKHTHVVFSLDDGRDVRFVDPRTFGEVYPSDGEPPTAGIDPVEDDFTIDDFAAVLARRRRRLKDMLMDQRAIAGIGNIYSDEILWTSRLAHDRVAATLRRPTIVRLHDAIVSVLGDAIEARGSSLADEQYRDLYGNVGSYAMRHQVYGREGLPCARCGGAITRIKFGGRSHFRCRRCQR